MIEEYMIPEEIKIDIYRYYDEGNPVIYLNGEFFKWHYAEEIYEYLLIHLLKLGRPIIIKEYNIWIVDDSGDDFDPDNEPDIGQWPHYLKDVPEEELDAYINVTSRYLQ